MVKQKFGTGSLVMTRGVADKVAENEHIAKFMVDSLARHCVGDWGDLEQCDKDENELSLGKRLRLLSSYESDNGLPKIWIITEADRSVTTVLFPEEY